jgi:hypothetical protein
MLCPLSSHLSCLEFPNKIKFKGNYETSINVTHAVCAAYSWSTSYRFYLFSLRLSDCAQAHTEPYVFPRNIFHTRNTGMDNPV